MTTRAAVLTSGGDSPGMNAAIRSVVRCGSELGLTMFGVRRGYAGLIEGDMIPLDDRSVGGIIERGGTMLRSARSPEFLTSDGQHRALETLEENALDGLVVIGGNGTLSGARWLSEQGVSVVGIPASIDNDIPGTDMAIGVDTALNTVVEGLNRIRDTAVAHERAFVIEVMGRSSGYIALMAGLAGGAEIVLLPEFPRSLEDIANEVVGGVRKGKRHSIIVVAEGFRPTDTELNGRSPGRAIVEHLQKAGTLETRLTIFGHVQRGGSPTAFDRILASRFGQAAATWLAEGRVGVTAGLCNGAIAPVPLKALSSSCENVERALYQLVQIVAH